MTDYRGLVLLGPTGAGKTPLGEWIEAAGLEGQRFKHFDFGANLRQVVAEDNEGREFSTGERAFLHDLLRSGALLEDEHFPLAERILRAFLKQQCAGGQVQVVLNGLPRHAGQAAAVGRIVQVHAVVSLECPMDVVLARIRTNVGGDRSERSDDDQEAIRRKLEIFRERTRPLLEYYRRVGSRMVVLPVTADMTPQSAWQALQKQLGG